MVDLILLVLTCLVFFIAGNLYNKGITININQTPTFTADEYNHSIGTDDPETRQYSEESNGVHKF
jgi:hypothetical protein